MARTKCGKCNKWGARTEPRGCTCPPEIPERAAKRARSESSSSSTSSSSSEAPRNQTTLHTCFQSHLQTSPTKFLFSIIVIPQVATETPQLDQAGIETPRLDVQKIEIATLQQVGRNKYKYTTTIRSVPTSLILLRRTQTSKGTSQPSMRTSRSCWRLRRQLSWP